MFVVLAGLSLSTKLALLFLLKAMMVQEEPDMILKQCWFGHGMNAQVLCPSYFIF